MGGEGRLSEVFKSQASYYRSAQPRVVRSTSDRGLTTVQYVVTGSDGDRVPRSVIFRRVDGGWEIVFDSYLDQALAGYVQTVTQQAIDPKADEPSRTAVKAGEGASRLQSRWLNDFFCRPVASRAAYAQRTRCRAQTAWSPVDEDPTPPTPTQPSRTA